MGNASKRMRNPNHKHRTGRYVSQPLGYRAFIPAPLPPDPPIRLQGELLALVSRADRALGRLDGSIQTLPHPDLFVFMYVRKEAVLSSQIEGTQSSLRDVLAAEAGIFSPTQPKDVLSPFRLDASWSDQTSYFEKSYVGSRRTTTVPSLCPQFLPTSSFCL